MSAAAWLVLAAGLSGQAAAADSATEWAAAQAAFAIGDVEATEAHLAPIRAGSKSEACYWPAGLLWARCAALPAEAERRFREVAEDAPPETRSTCELELAHLLALAERWPEAEAAYGAWLTAWPQDARGPAVRYWRAVALREAGREAEAAQEAVALSRTGTADEWRAPAALLAAELAAGRGAQRDAHAAYVALAAAGWGASVRPAALLGAARTAANADETGRYSRELDRGYPDSPEAAAARAMLRSPKRGGLKFGVQVGAYRSEANARTERARWKKKGRAAVVVRRNLAGYGTLACVVVGPFATPEEAARARDALKAAGASAQVISY